MKPGSLQGTVVTDVGDHCREQNIHFVLLGWK